MKHVILGSFALLMACSARDGGAPIADSSPLERCDEKVHCAGDFAPFDTFLRRTDGVCHFGGFELYEDGTAQDDGTWDGTAAHFTFCNKTSGTMKCRTCDAIDETPAPTIAAGHCTGSPDSCSTNSPGSCSDIVGCRMASHLRYDGSWDNECEGNPADCEDMTDEKHCNKQGCVWK